MDRRGRGGGRGFAARPGAAGDDGAGELRAAEGDPKEGRRSDDDDDDDENWLCNVECVCFGTVGR